MAWVSVGVEDLALILTFSLIILDHHDNETLELSENKDWVSTKVTDGQQNYGLSDYQGHWWPENIWIEWLPGARSSQSQTV